MTQSSSPWALFAQVLYIQIGVWAEVGKVSNLRQIQNSSQHQFNPFFLIFFFFFNFEIQEAFLYNISRMVSAAELSPRVICVFSTFSLVWVTVYSVCNSSSEMKAFPVLLKLRLHTIKAENIFHDRFVSSIFSMDDVYPKNKISLTSGHYSSELLAWNPFLICEKLEH